MRFLKIKSTKKGTAFKVTTSFKGHYHETTSLAIKVGPKPAESWNNSKWYHELSVAGQINIKSFTFD